MVPILRLLLLLLKVGLALDNDAAVALPASVFLKESSSSSLATSAQLAFGKFGSAAVCSLDA
jgi:hypothetical protein